MMQYYREDATGSELRCFSSLWIEILRLELIREKDRKREEQRERERMRETCSRSNLDYASSLLRVQ